MISAIDALLLPSAKLSADELAAVDALLGAIEAHVREKMERRGCDLQVKEARGNVIAEVNQRLKADGWNPKWQPLTQEGKFSRNVVIVGYLLALAPSDEAYRDAAQREAN